MGKKEVVRIVSIGILMGLWACFEPPVIPNEPKISFNNISYINVDGGSDSLILTFNFEDGDGDIGLGAEDVYPPYHSFNYVYENPNNPRKVKYGDSITILPLALYSNFGELVGEYDYNDQLPPFGCEDYRLEQDLFADSSAADKIDTVLIQKNVYNKNIYVDFYRKVRGVYELINDDFSQGSCVEFFNSRIPVFDASNIGGSLTGNISFAMLSQGFRTTFRNDSIKLSFFIYDRALNKSNVTDTPDFLLSEITKD